MAAYGLQQGSECPKKGEQKNEMLRAFDDNFFARLLGDIDARRIAMEQRQIAQMNSEKESLKQFKLHGWIVKQDCFEHPPRMLLKRWGRDVGLKGKGTFANLDIATVKNRLHRRKIQVHSILGVRDWKYQDYFRGSIGNALHCLKTKVLTI
eukprot:scaffold553_cov17-Tisochrysis_lutea.AAC.1